MLFFRTLALARVQPSTFKTSQTVYHLNLLSNICTVTTVPDWLFTWVSAYFPIEPEPSWIVFFIKILIMLNVKTCCLCLLWGPTIDMKKKKEDF